VAHLSVFRFHVAEFPARFRQLLQQRRRFPPEAVLPFKFLNAFEHFGQPQRVGVKHRPTAMRGESVAIHINDVDVHRAQGDAIFQNARAFIDQRIHHPVEDFLWRNFAADNASCGGALGDDFFDAMNQQSIANRAALMRTDVEESMQLALAESEAQFRLLAENSSDMISRHDANGTFLYVSPACRIILGYEPEELTGTLLWLLSDASRFVSGEVICVDGGFHIFSGV